MIAVHKLLQASSPVKRWVVLTGMKAVGKYEGLHGLVANPQPNPQCTESNSNWMRCTRRPCRWRSG